PFVGVNMTAIPESLFESELFGHKKDSFTGAGSDRTGLLPKASGGTLFLDEIGDMSPGMQAKLLRALQEKMVRRVGAEEEVPFDVRLVSATHHDLETALEEGRFRQDLYFRLNVIQVEVPRYARAAPMCCCSVSTFSSGSPRPAGSGSAASQPRRPSVCWP